MSQMFVSPVSPLLIRPMVSSSCTVSYRGSESSGLKMPVCFLDTLPIDEKAQAPPHSFSLASVPECLRTAQIVDFELRDLSKVWPVAAIFGSQERRGHQDLN